MVLILSIVVLLSAATWVMSDRVLPPFFKARTDYHMREIQKRRDFFLDLQRDKIWYRSMNMIYNLQRFDYRLKTIFGMSVYTFDEDFNLIEVVEAERAVFDRGEWILQNGTVTVFSSDTQFPLMKAFQKKQMHLAETPLDFKEIDKEVEGLRTQELSRYIERMRKAGADTKAFEVKFHSRSSLSFMPILMCFLAVPFSLKTRREAGAAKDLLLCLLVTFFYWLFYSVSLSLGISGALPPWLAAWLPSLIFVVLAATLIARKKS
jgi:lipopolysaccharide export system permease protein